MKTWENVSEKAMAGVASEILEKHKTARIMVLSGDLGAGKTTMIRHFCRILGVTEPVQSPTYAIIHEYGAANAEPVYHMDLYRIQSADQLSSLGLEDYLYSGHFCFIEWPEVAENLLPGHCVRIQFYGSGPNRTITMECDE